MYKSNITVHYYYIITDYKGCKHTYDSPYTDEMLIPLVIGMVRRGFARVVNISRLLPIGHRFRGDVLI